MSERQLRLVNMSMNFKENNNDVILTCRTVNNEIQCSLSSSSSNTDTNKEPSSIVDLSASMLEDIGISMSTTGNPNVA